MKKQSVDQLFFQLLWKSNNILKAEGKYAISFLLFKKIKQQIHTILQS